MLQDTPLLAYFRFTEADPLGSELTAQKAQITSATYQTQRDYSINDICQPINNYLRLYRFKTDNDFQTLNLDARYSPSTINWGYTMSVWMQLNSTTCYQSNPLLAKQNCYLFLLQDAFMIFSPAPNQIAAYFFNQKAYYQYQTKSINLPYNQWFNLQFITSQYLGYEFRVYDILGRQMSTVTESRNLQEVFVQNKKLQIFSQFRGIVKNLILYTVRKSLPLSFPYVDFTAVDPYIIDNDCLIYLEFQKQFMFSSQPTKLKNLCRNYQYGQLPISLSNDDDYVGTYFKIFANVTNDGLINTPSKFDGVACEDGDELLEIKSISGVISSQTVKAIPSSPNVTLEFWFKSQVPMIRTLYISSLWGNTRAQQYFSVFYESSNNKKLICAPFGYSSTTSPFVAFNGYNDANIQTSGWFHIACQYEQSKELVGYLYNSNNVEEKQVTSLTSSNLMIPADTYTINVGNDPTLAYGTIGTRFKEVRLWGFKRTQSDVQYWRFRQMDPKQFTSDQLLIYLRMNEGSYREYNAAQLIDTTLTYPVVAFSDVGYESDSDMTVCPTTTFLASDKNCYLDPVQYVDGAIYPVYNPTNSTLSWFFSAEESIMMDTSVQNQIRTSWIFDDSNTQALTSKNGWYKQGIDYKVPSGVFRDESVYNVRLNFSNADQSYVQYKDFKFVPRSCQYYIVSGSDAYSNYLNYTQMQSKYDLVYTLVPVQLKTYCNDISFYNQVLPNITYKFSPPLSQQPFLNFTINADQTISVTIPASEQSKFPAQQNISIILNLQYGNSYYLQQGIAAQSDLTFQNVKQTINFSVVGYTMTTSINTNATNQKVYMGEGVFINAYTYITNSDNNDYKRLTYTWTCPQLISSLCPTTNSSQLFFNGVQFPNNNGVYGQAYNFSVNISYTDSQGQVVTQVKSINITWLNIVSPTFYLQSPSQVLSTADNQTFSLTFAAYPTAANIPSTVNITWSIVPNISSSLYSITNSKTQLTVRAGGFLTTTTYTINVTVYNISDVLPNLNMSRSTTFTTGQPPQGGQVSITPFFGYVNQTNLTVSLLNWASSYRPIKYKVWTTTNAGGSILNYALSDWITDSQTFKFVPKDTFPYQIQITDMSNEVVYVKNSPVITVPTNSNSSGTVISLIQQQQKLQIILDTTSIQDKYASLTQFASNELNTTTVDTTNQTTTSQDTSSNNQTSDSAEILAKTQSKIAIVDNLQTDTQQILDQLKNESDTSIVSKGALQVLNVILADTKTLTAELATKTVTVIENILQQDTTIVTSLLKDQTFLSNFAQSISSLMNFNNGQSTSRRLLQQDQVSSLNDQIRQLMATLEDTLCQQSVENQGKQSQVTSAFSLIAQKFTLDNTIQSDTFKYVDDSATGVTFNVPQITQSLKQSSTSVLDTFCILSTFLKSSNNQYQTDTQQQYSPQIVDYEIYNARTKQSYQPTLYTPQDNVMIEFAVNPSTFKNNQTICMSYSSTNNQWSGDTCITTIDTDRNSLKCSCTVIDSNEYALINDYARVEGPQIQFSAKPNIGDEDSISQQSVHTVESSYSFMMMATLLLVVMFGLPVASYIFDKRDSKINNEKELDKSTIKFIERLQKLSDKPQKYWMMRLIEIQEISIGSKSMFSLIMQEIHPLVNILSKYSVEQPRLFRFATLSFQVSLFSLIATLAFNPNYRQGDASRIEDGLDQHDIQQVMILGFVGTILLIPASFISRTFEKSIKAEESQNVNVNQTEQSRNLQYLDINGVNEPNTVQISPSKVLYTSQRIFQKNISQTVETQRPALQNVGQQQNQEITITQKCKPLFFMLLALAYILAITTITLCFVYASQMPVSNQYCLVASFYIGFIGSIMASNVIRVAINTFLIETYIKSNGVKQFILKLILARETIEIYQTVKMIKEAVNEKSSQDGTQQQLISNQNQINEQPGNTTTKNLTGGMYHLSRGQSIDISKCALDFQRPVTDQDNHDLQDSSIYIDQLQQIDDEPFHSKCISPSQLKSQLQSQINIEDVDYDLNSSVDVRAESIESHNMKSISPMTQSVMNDATGAKGLFNSLRRENSNKNVVGTSNFNSTRSLKNSKQTSPDFSKTAPNQVDLQRYSQIGQLNKSNNNSELILDCDDSNRAQ